MRNIHKLSFGITSGIPSSSIRGCTDKTVYQSFSVPETAVPTCSAFSQTSRSTAMSRNFQDAMGFTNRQAEVLSTMISNLESYLSQTRENDEVGSLQESYLLYARALEAGIGTCFRGKPLFDNLVDKPLRIHLQVRGEVRPIDLPNPQLSGVPALQGFILGAARGGIPSEALICECLSILMDFLLDIRTEQEKINHYLGEFQAKYPQAITHSVPTASTASPLRLPKFKDLSDIITTAWHAFLGSIGLKTA